MIIDEKAVSIWGESFCISVSAEVGKLIESFKEVITCKLVYLLESYFNSMNSNLMFETVFSISYDKIRLQTNCIALQFTITFTKTEQQYTRNRT